MTNPTCQRWMDDPEGSERHAAECPECGPRAAELRALDLRLAAVSAEPAGSLAGLITDRMPVAPWEDARHRSWGLIAAVAAAVALMAAALFLAIGISPADGFAGLVRGVVGRREIFRLLSESAGTFLRQAPTSFHVLIGIGVVAINAILIAMLRRGPRGYDVRPR